MMNTIRNILIVVAVIAIAYFAITFISNIVPILVTAVAAFVLGRLSVHFDLLGFIRNARSAAQTVQAAATTTAAAAPVIAKAAEKPTPAKAAPAKAAPAAVEKAAERLADEPQKDESILLDPNFEIKTPEQIEAEARQREQAAKEKAATANADAVQAALEERRKRLLGGKE
jgi:hypothetical protein